MSFHSIRTACLVAASIAATSAMAAEPYVNATIGGVIQPGVYGRIEIGTQPPPPVLYPKPVIIERVPTVVQAQPVYLYVPPGHAKNWRKHCHRYNACGQQVYFLDETRYMREHGHDKRGKHGKGHGHDKHD